MDKCLSLFKVLKGGMKFKWNEECKESFQGLKKNLGHASILSKPKDGKPLFVYFVVSSDVLIREEDNLRFSIFYISKDLLSIEAHHRNM